MLQRWSIHLQDNPVLFPRNHRLFVERVAMDGWILDFLLGQDPVLDVRIRTLMLLSGWNEVRHTSDHPNFVCDENIEQQIRRNPL